MAKKRASPRPGTLPAPSGTLQGNLFAPESAWRPPELSSLPSWEGARRVAVDCETRDEHLKELGPGWRRGAYVVGVSFAIEDGPAHYLPFRHGGGDNLPADAVIRYLRAQAETFTGSIVGANLQYDLDGLANEEINFTRAAFFRDVQVAEPLLDELQMSYSLDSIAERWGIPGKATSLLDEACRAFGIARKSMWRLPARYVGEYAEQDVRLPLTLIRRQERKLDEQDLMGVYDLESRLLPVLVRMRRRGVRVSLDRVDQIERWSMEQESEKLREISHLTGVRLSLGDSTKATMLARALKAIGIEVPSTAQGKDSITKEFLASIDHPVAALIRRARQMNKLRGTFCSSVRRYQTNGRIHCTFNQLRTVKEDAGDGGEEGGARYGRLSCVDPNMQQQPSRDDFAARWRSIYLADEGGEFASLDFSQQEPRWTVHFAEVCKLPRAYEAAEAYRTNPDTDNHQMMADLSGVPRKQAKELFLGKCYGMGGAKLCMKLSLPTRWAAFPPRGEWDLGTYYGSTYGEALNAVPSDVRLGYRVFEVAGEEGQRIIDRFDTQLPFVKRLAKMCEERARERGFITTIAGRRCRFPYVNGAYDWTHKALNRLIQGSSADQTKAAMVELDAQGFPLQLQVHDELNWTVSSREEAMAGAEVMRNVIPLRVPMKVDVEIGPSWGEAA